MFGTITTKAADDQTAANKPGCAVTAGQKAPAFQARIVESQTINFPDDYKGKVVLLDFLSAGADRAAGNSPMLSPPVKNFTPTVSKLSASAWMRPGEARRSCNSSRDMA